MIILVGLHFMNQDVCSCCIREFSVKSLGSLGMYVSVCLKLLLH